MSERRDDGRKRTAPRAKPPRAGRSAAWRTSSRGRGQAPRILIIEDEPASLDVLRLLLEYDRYEVAAAADGRTALRLLDRFEPHLVVMDWRLPGLSGRELYDAIEHRRSGSRVPVVIVSSAEEPFQMPGPFGVARLRKPLDVARFRTIVASILARVLKDRR